MTPHSDRRACLTSFYRPPLAVRLVCLASAVALAGTDGAAEEFPLQGRSRIHLASASEGVEIIGQVDDFVERMGPLERQLRLQAERPVSREEYLQFARQQVLEWTPDEAEQLRELIEPLSERCERFEPLWPEHVVLIKTTGREEGQAPHCRGNAIVLPGAMLQREPLQVQKVLIHELFHILSRQSAERRAAMYEIVGFRTVAPIALPEIWQERRMTNPDAPQIDCVIQLNHEGRPLDLAPVLMTRKEAYDAPLREVSLFDELLFGLMPVEQQGEIWVPTDEARRGKLFRPQELPEYSTKIGRNTRYVIHPEEILADNFVHLVLQTPSLPDPWIVDKLARRLQKQQP